MGKVVGIDLGTTNSVVAVMEGGKPVVIANAEGMRTTPSVVGFSKEGERLVGQMARRQSVLNPQNTFFGVKRFIGRRYSELNPDSKRVPYTVRKDDAGNVKLPCPRLNREFAPEEISAMVLRKLADEASRYLGQPVTSAVITVPAYFNDSQRQATRDAGRIAGLEVLRILNEPTAAALAYGLDRRDNETILVFDLGGGTFDVSVLDVGDGVFQVRATSGDTQLGGNDFDKKIVDWLADQYMEQNNGEDLRRNRQALQRLTEAAEKAKIELSGVAVTEINLPFISADENGPKHLETRLTRSQFEGMCTDLVTRLRTPVKRALADAGLSPSQIDEVVLVGGATRMPMVKQLVRSLIDQEPNQNVNPDEVVAVGAAIQAAILSGEIKDVLLLDVTPLSLGLETIGGVMKKVIPRNTTIPVRRSDIFSTSENNQTSVEIHALQGEREMAADNKSLGRFKLNGIPPAPRGIPQVLVSFDIDANGILEISALDKTTGRAQSITIQGSSTLSEAEVQRMIQEAEDFAEEDRKKREKITKRTNAEALTFKAERELREVALDFGMYFARDYRRQIERLIQELREHLENNNDQGIDRAHADLQDALYNLGREVYQRQKEEEEEEGFFNAIKRTFKGDDEDDNPREREFRESFRPIYRNDRDDDRSDYDRDRSSYVGGYGESERRYDRSPGRESGQDFGRGYNRGYDQDNRNNDRYDERDRTSGRPDRNSYRSDDPPVSRNNSRASSRDKPRQSDWQDDRDRDKSRRSARPEEGRTSRKYPADNWDDDDDDWL